MNLLRMALMPILLLSIPHVAQKHSSPHFDLKGETLGESLEAFKKAHPYAHCSRTEPARQAQLGEEACTVYRDISFAGLPALSDGDCDQIESKVGDGRNCWEGLTGSFRNGKLSMLSYTVRAEGGRDWALSQVMSALTDKYGKPDGKGWFNDKEVLVVHTVELSVGQGKEKVSVVIISLATNEDYAKKDI